MGFFSALQALCEGNPPVTGRFPSQRPATQRFDVFSDLRLNKRLSKLTRRRWFETPLLSLWRHFYVLERFRKPVFWEKFHQQILYWNVIMISLSLLMPSSCGEWNCFFGIGSSTIHWLRLKVETESLWVNMITPWFSTKMPSYQYRRPRCGDKTISPPSYLHKKISFTGIWHLYIKSNPCIHPCT